MHEARGSEHSARSAECVQLVVFCGFVGLRGGWQLLTLFVTCSYGLIFGVLHHASCVVDFISTFAILRFHKASKGQYCSISYADISVGISYTLLQIRISPIFFLTLDFLSTFHFLRFCVFAVHSRWQYCIMLNADMFGSGDSVNASARPQHRSFVRSFVRPFVVKCGVELCTNKVQYCVQT